MMMGLAMRIVANNVVLATIGRNGIRRCERCTYWRSATTSRNERVKSK
jgi:hypothetical protein